MTFSASRRARLTNREANAMGITPCGWEPAENRESRLGDPFHSRAEDRFVSPEHGPLLVCRSCRDALRQRRKLELVR
jgi:hypothetical protein